MAGTTSRCPGGNEVPQPYATTLHKVLIAKNVIGAYEKGDGWDFGN